MESMDTSFNPGSDQLSRPCKLSRLGFRICKNKEVGLEDVQGPVQM